MNKNSFVYILANSHNTVFYVGVTSDLVKRVFEHKNGLLDGFTKKYNVHKLVYFEVFDNIEYAILREKQLKKWKREYKLRIIQKMNPEFDDFYLTII